MAITLTGSGGLFTRLGKLGHALNTLNTARGTTIAEEIIDAVETVDAENSATIREAVAPLLAALSQGQASLGSLANAIQLTAEQLVIRQVHADNPLPQQTIELALAELVRQMLVGDHYVDANAVAASATQTSLDGDGVVVASVKHPSGANIETLLAEDLECRVVANATAGSETIEVRGEDPQGDPLHWLWPAGSQAFRQYTAIDAEHASNNLLANGGFEDTTGTDVDDWTADVGAYNTDWLIEASTVYAGSSAIELVGDGATLAQLSQDITANVAALRQYAFVIWLRRDATPAAAGALTIDLYDGSSVIADEAGDDNELVIDLTALTTSYVAYKASFRLPEPLPAEVTLRMRLSTALTSGRSVFLDHAALAQMFQPQTSNPGLTPYLAFFSGAANWSKDDYTGGGDGGRVFRVATTNDNASLWQQLFHRLFRTSERRIQLPVAGSNLINDSLIG